MTPQQKALIQETWQDVVPIADQAASLFYERLFETDPQIRVLFAEVDMAAQRRKLVRALSDLVGALDSIEAFLPALEELGRRHVDYGVRDKHYETVGESLLWTLEKGLGENWTPQAEAAWTAAYALVADTMRGASKAPAEPTTH